AEDGIRDGHVTGVQTCALPISNERAGRGAAGGFATGFSTRPRTPTIGLGAAGAAALAGAAAGFGAGAAAATTGTAAAATSCPFRSEERRVGKECRCWGSQEPAI